MMYDPIANYLHCDAPSLVVVRKRRRRMRKKVALNHPKLREVVFLGLLTYGIKIFCLCQNSYGFDGPPNIEDMTYSTFFKLDQTQVLYIIDAYFLHFFQRRKEIS